MARPTTERSDPIDVEIGARIRTFRLARRMTQSDLGRAIERTFPQIQKYENGANRIAASTLIRVAQALGVSPRDLLSPESIADQPAMPLELMATPGAGDLLGAYSQLSAPARKALRELAAVMAAQS